MALSITIFCVLALFSVLANNTETKQEVLQNWLDVSPEQLEMQELLIR